MKKVQKGESGYIHSQKICRSFITFILLLIPVVIFFIGLAIYHKRENMFTFVAIMGCLPGCRYAVGMIMMLLQKETDPAVYEKTRKAAGELPALYDCVFTAYEKTTSVDALVLGQGSVIGYSSNPKTNPEYIEKHLTEILQGNNVKRTVKIFKDYRKFETRVKEMAASESAGDEKRKNEKAVDVLKAIAL